MQASSYTVPIVIVGMVFLAIGLAAGLGSPLFAIPIALVAIGAYLVMRSLIGARPGRPGARTSGTPTTAEAAHAGPERVSPRRRAGRVVQPTPDPAVDRRSAESFPASDPPATY